MEATITADLLLTRILLIMKSIKKIRIKHSKNTKPSDSLNRLKKG